MLDALCRTLDMRLFPPSIMAHTNGTKCMVLAQTANNVLLTAGWVPPRPRAAWVLAPADAIAWVAGTIALQGCGIWTRASASESFLATAASSRGRSCPPMTHAWSPHRSTAP